MSKIKVLFVERQLHEFVSLERVFRQVASSFNPSRFTSEFQQLPFANGLAGTVRNLLQFRPKPADIYHMTGHAHYIVLVLPADRTVLTIHDLRFVHDRKGLRRFILKKLLLDLPIRRLKYITAISESTRAEIVKYTQCDPSLIRVIENPIRDEFLKESSGKSFDRVRPTILQIGTTENKNIPRVIEALKGIPCRLVIVGRISESTHTLSKEFGVEVENLTDLSDQQVVKQYQQADIVTFCSTYEGFGMPVIEAQSLGIPVITSNLSPMKEVAGQGALLVDPFSTEKIREGILTLINNADLRERIVAAGFENMLRFESRGIARRYEALYEEVFAKIERR